MVPINLSLQPKKLHVHDLATCCCEFDTFRCLLLLNGRCCVMMDKLWQTELRKRSWYGSYEFLQCFGQSQMVRRTLHEKFFIADDSRSSKNKIWVCHYNHTIKKKKQVTFHHNFRKSTGTGITIPVHGLFRCLLWGGFWPIQGSMLICTTWTTILKLMKQL